MVEDVGGLRRRRRRGARPIDTVVAAGARGRAGVWFFGSSGNPGHYEQIAIDAGKMRRTLLDPDNETDARFARFDATWADDLPAMIRKNARPPRAHR